MGRKSSLTEKQWSEIGQRLLKGDKGRVLAREYGISEAAIRKRFGTQTKEIKDVANQIVAAETAFAKLPIGAQISARTLADELKDISTHLACAARFGAMTAHRLAGIAHGQVEKIDDAEPEKSSDALVRIGGLMKMANLSAEIGVNILRANKENMGADDEPPTPVGISFQTQNAKRDDDN
jgi:hypothetical protein